MNFVYVLIGLVPLFFLRKCRRGSGRGSSAWRDLHHVSALRSGCSTAAGPAEPRPEPGLLHRVAFHHRDGLGYGLAILGAYLSLHYQRSGNYCLFVRPGRAFVALLHAGPFSGAFNFSSLVIDLDASYNPIVRLPRVQPVPDAGGRGHIPDLPH